MLFVVTKPFTYAGQPLARGDAWEPAGHRNDPAIIAGRFVTVAEDVAAAQAAAAPRRRRREVAE